MKERNYPALGERCYCDTLPSGLSVYVIPRPGMRVTHALVGVPFGSLDARVAIAARRRTLPAGTAWVLGQVLMSAPDLAPYHPRAVTLPDFTGCSITCSGGWERPLRALLHAVYDAPLAEVHPDTPDQGEDALMKGLYQDALLCQPVQGTQRSRARLTPETLNQCRRAFCHPSRLTLCVVGDVEPQRAIQLAAAIPITPSPKIEREPGEPEPPQSVEQEIVCAAPGRERFALGFKAEPTPTLRQALALELASETVLGRHAPLVEQLLREGLLETDYRLEVRAHPGFACLTCTGASRDPAAVADRFLQEGVSLAWSGLSDAVFQRVKKRVWGRHLLALDDPERLNLALARTHCATGTCYLDFDRLLGEITRQETQTLLQETISAQRSCLLILHSKGA